MPMIEEVQSFAEVQLAHEALSHLEADYPGFSDWFWQTVYPGLVTERRQILLARRDGALAGVAIGRRGRKPAKLCTLWVAPEFAGAGTGSILLENICDWLGTDTPAFTVSAERMDTYAWLVRRTGAKVARVDDSRYRPGVREFVFRG